MDTIMVNIDKITTSKTENNFSKDEIPLFKKWLKDKGYLKTDCWCKHIEEFKNKGQ